MTPFSYFLKNRTVKMKLFAITTLFLGLFIISYLLIAKWKSEDDEKVTFLKRPWNVTFKHIVVHFDLKGAPPLLKYLESTLKPLKDRGTTALLIEYEDMFPYDGTLVNLPATNHYGKNELKQFLMSVDQIGLEVIPLVPTFGHLEFALKLKEFQHLREDPKFPDSICPSKKESQDFLREMLRQVIKFHSMVAPLKHIHIGFNEVHQIKVCKLCSKRNSSKTSIILEHIKFINDVIGDLSPGTRILLWDDMLRHNHLAESKDLKFRNVESVTWDYSTDYNKQVSLHPVFNRHQRMFGNQWLATAYKGADGSKRTIPILRSRFLNLLYWLNFLMIYNGINKYDFKGIILTGRSRYSHMEPLCELLPVAMPSLILNLILIEKYHNGISFYKLHSDKDYEVEESRFISYFITVDFNSALMCQKTIIDGSLESFQALTCIFEGSDLYVLLSRYVEAITLYTQMFFLGHDTEFTSVMTIDDMKLGYMKMIDVDSLLKMSSSFMQGQIMLDSEVVDSMTLYFDKYVIGEFITEKTSKMKKTVQEFVQFLGDYYVVKDWPRRYSHSKTSESWQDEVKKEIQGESNHE